MEVIVTYEQDGENGAVSVHGTDYYAARDEAFSMVPEGAQRLNIRVDRDQ